jgi:ATP dependent DNA ligase domain/ATP dependent DNA ligase C terminal region
VRYLIVAEAYRDLEQLSSRLALTDRLAALVADTPAGLLPTVCYLCQGLIAPEFAGVDLGLAEKLAVRALATVAGTDPAEVADPAALDATFAQAVTDGCEGLVCKSTGPDSVYQAGARGWQWIKLKRDYRTELSDTADLVVIGAFAGRGRRTGGYGAVLLAAYDVDAGVFRAVTKCGAGFSDADLAALPARLAPLLSPGRPAWSTRARSRTSGLSRGWCSRSSAPSSPCRRITPPRGASSRRTPAWPCASRGSPAAGTTTRRRPTPPPPASWPSCSWAPGARPPESERPLDTGAAWPL